MTIKKFTGPLFIIGSPRSGTSLLRLILTSHSDIVIPPECGFIIWLYNKYSDWQVSDSNNITKLELFLDDLMECKKFDTWMLSRKTIKSQLQTNPPKNYSELCSVVYASFGHANKQKFSIWGDKNNFHLNHLNELLSLYKNARFLHIVRDGRDIACSYREVMAANSDSPYAPKLKTEIVDIALEWSGNVLKIDSFMSSMSDDVTMTVKYEDLALKPSHIINKICQWLNIPFEPNMLEFYQENKHKKLEPALTLDWKQRTLEPISANTVERYITSLSNEEQAKFLVAAQDALCKFSYV